MNRATSVTVLTHAIAAARAGKSVGRYAEARALRAVAAAERLATAARHAANAIAAQGDRRECHEPHFDMVDIRTELLIALEIFEQLPDGYARRHEAKF